MAPLSLAQDSTTQLVLQTIDAYERSAKECVARWSKRRHRRPPLLVKWLKCLPADARLLDLGCGGGQDAVDIVHYRWFSPTSASSPFRRCRSMASGLPPR